MSIDRRFFSDSLLACLILVGLIGLASPRDALSADCNANSIDDSLEPDADGDGIPNACDNCRLTPNPAQVDSNADGTGNRCDSDLDGDQVVGLADFNIFRSCYGGNDADCDFDDDGGVGPTDFAVFGTFFGDLKERGRQPIQIVRGYIATSLQDATGAPGSHIYLPAIEVYLLEVETGVESEPVPTDLSGRFTLYGYVPGRYVICWRAEGFQDGCDFTFHSFPSEPIHAGVLRIWAESAEGYAAVSGQVDFADGSRPRLLAPAANINVTAEVAVRNAAGDELSRVLVNNFGEYFLPSAPSLEQIQLVALVDGEEKVQNIAVEANLAGAPAHQINLRFANRPPRVDPPVVTSGGAHVRTGLPGTSVDLTVDVSDPDGDPLSYLWSVSLGGGTLVTPTSESTEWKLPEQDGFYSVFLLVSDGRGGYSQANLSLRVDNLGIPFSGRVLAPGGSAVPGASVEVNGSSVTSDAEGRFGIRVTDADRFVFNIRASGYALLSQIYDDAVTGGVWTLNPGSVYLVDPTVEIVLSDLRDERNCPGPRSASLNYEQFPGSENPVWQDGQGNVVAQFADKPPVPLPGHGETTGRICPPGLKVMIPANSLVDSDGNPPPGLVEVTLSTVDLDSPFQMPGDYTVALPGGGTMTMQSYGAGGVEISAGGTEYNLKSGFTAEVGIPVDPSQLAAPGAIPPTIPILYYDEVLGTWAEEGSATLVGNTYEYAASHFSTINADLVFSNQACVRVLSPSLEPSYDLEIHIPQGTAAPKIITTTIDNSSPQKHVIYYLPTHTNIVLVPIRTTGPVDTPIGTFVVDTGDPQAPAQPGKPDGPDYVACSTEVVLFDLVIPDVPLSGEFLHGLYTFGALNLTELDIQNPTLSGQIDVATDAYYAQIDPRDKRETLAEFQSTNGFGTPGGTEEHVTFANSGDLGFGRDMYCKRTGSDVGCYVTNYGSIDTPDAADVAEAVAGTPGVRATVAMEYSRIESQLGQPVEFDDPERVVKFYLYIGNNRENRVSLDNLGDRPIPQLCMVCHGGEYPSGPVFAAAPAFTDREDVKLGSRFLPFDLSLYTFDTAPFDKASQQNAFKVLNELMVDNSPPNAVISELISEMYNGVNPAIQDEDLTVLGWESSVLEKKMYTEVIAASCRTCHIGHKFPTLQFDTSSGFQDRLGQAESRVCNQYVMPHAKVTYDLFWSSTSDHQPATFQLYGDQFKTLANGWNGTFCGDYTPGGTTPVTFYESVIQNIYDNTPGPGLNDCTNCHPGQTGAGGLGLGVGASHGTTVGVFSSQVGTMERVKAGDHSNSYLWHKINGSHGSVGGSGTGPMPQGGFPMDPTVDVNPTVPGVQNAVDTIRDWINAGATQN